MNQFPGTNYHDLNLNWLLGQMKNCLAEWETTKGQWTALAADNEEFKEYVTNYLANLDLTQEISDKIDALVEDGTLLRILTEDEGEGSPLSDTVGEWLAAHITQETGYVIDDTLTVQGAAADAKAAGDRITDLEDDIESITNATVDPSQLYDDSNPNIINAYSNGVNFIGGSNFRTLYIPCKPNTAYTVSWTKNIFSSMTVIQSENTPAPSGSAMPFSAENVAQFATINGRIYCTNVTKSNANYLAVYYCNTNTATSTEAEIRATIMIAEGTEKTEYRQYTINLKIKESALPDILIPETYERGSYVRADSMTANDEITFNVGNIKKNDVIGFSANISTFGSLMIGQGKTALNQTAYIVVDATTVKVYRYTTEPIEWVSLNHGLTIADYIDVCIEVSDTEIGWAKLRITSNGQTYTYNRMAWMGCGAAVYASAISGSYTNCNLSYFCADYNKDLWLFGDSYFDHWITYALSYGFNNFLCDGYSGRKSDAAFVSLERDMQHGKPNTIVWCMGMNDGDSSSAVNASWVYYYTLLVSLAEANNINLILCTIPNTPTVNNTYKNAIIRNSGHRYIDLAKAVGSDISSSWYAGLLSSDNVHPSTLGDEMIARFFESAIPEIK